MVGGEDWNDHAFDIIQVGSQHWVGPVVAWKGIGGSDAHGERKSGSAEGQWAAGDKILLQSCNGKYQFIRIIY